MTHIPQYISAPVLAICVSRLVLVILVDLWRTLRLFFPQRTVRKFGPEEPKGHNFLRGDGWHQPRRPARRARASVLTANLRKES